MPPLVYLVKRKSGSLSPRNLPLNLSIEEKSRSLQALTEAMISLLKVLALKGFNLRHINWKVETSILRAI